ncbi:hypothetical protein XB02_19335 [Pantoea ananatis]|nr:hypothetical protein XB02_19335 [Pantoea ananatis]
MKMLSTKSLLKTAAFALTVFLLNQGSALAETASPPSQPFNTSMLSQLQNTTHRNGNIILVRAKTLGSGQRVNPACDDTGTCYYDDITDDAA